MRTVITTSVDEHGSIGFEVREEPGPWGRVLLTFVGEFDHEANAVVDAVAGRVWAGGASGVLVDLTGVTFINGHGLAAMLTLERSARVRRRALVLRCRPGTVCRLLGLVGLADRVQAAHPAEAAGGPGLRLVGDQVEGAGVPSPRRARRPTRHVGRRWHHGPL